MCGSICHLLPFPPVQVPLSQVRAFQAPPHCHSGKGHSYCRQMQALHLPKPSPHPAKPPSPPFRLRNADQARPALREADTGRAQTGVQSAHSQTEPVEPRIQEAYPTPRWSAGDRSQVCRPLTLTQHSDSPVLEDLSCSSHHEPRHLGGAQGGHLEGSVDRCLRMRMTEM